MTHTPGPWRFNADLQEVDNITPTLPFGSLRRRVATIHGHDAEYEANAQLIVASPDLLAVLTKHYATIAGHVIRLQAAHEDRAAAEWLCVAQDFASVIAQAKGRQPDPHQHPATRLPDVRR